MASFAHRTPRSTENARGQSVRQRLVMIVVTITIMMVMLFFLVVFVAVFRANDHFFVPFMKVRVVGFGVDPAAH